MADPISTIGSVIAVAGCAAESTKSIIRSVRGLMSAPVEIHTLSDSLEALSHTLLRIQQTSRQLSSSYQVPDQFSRRLEACLAQLAIHASEIKKVDTMLDTTAVVKGSQKKRIKRSAERIKWLGYGSHKMDCFLKDLRMYQSEFSLELSAMLLAVYGSASSSYPKSNLAILSQTQSLPPIAKDEHLKAATSNAEPVHLQKEALKCQVCPHKISDPQLMPSAYYPNYSIKNTFLLESRAFSSCFLRIGPLVRVYQASHSRTFSLSRSIGQEGFGCMICLVLPRRSGIAIHFQINLLRVLISGSMTYTMSWSLSFPRIISRGSKIFQSVLQGDIEGTKALFGDQSASSKDQTECGTTLLHIASGAQNVEMVRLLIREGADSNTPDQDGQTPLHEALAVEDNFDTARLLIENGADLANKTTEDRTPLHTFFTNTVRQVVSNADWMEETDADSEGLTLTHFLAWSNRSTVIDFQRGRAHDVVDIWAPDMRGRTCLHLAAYRGNMPVLEHLLEQTSTQEVQRTDRQGLTPLHYAVRSSRAVPTIDALLAKGSILSTRDCMGAGMLHHAGSWNNLAAVKHIAGMENGRRLLVPDIHGRLPSEYCKGEKACDVRKELLRMEADIALQFSANEDMSSRHRANDYVPQGSQGLLLMKEWYHGTNALGRNRVAFEYVIWLLVASIIVLILYKVDEGQ